MRAQVLIQAELIRGAIVQRLKAEGHDLAAALQD